jgi:branched-chain amino acid transport system permease protein
LLRRDVRRFLTSGNVGRSLSVRDLTLSFGGVTAVKQLSFVARPGEITSVIGPNGAGKTTALNLICGFYKSDLGAIQVGDTQIVAPSYRIARAGIARTYQASQLFATLSVLDNILIALRRGQLGFDAFG